MPPSSSADWSKNHAALEFCRLVEELLVWNHDALEVCRLVEESCRPRVLQIGRRIMLPSRSADWSKNHSSLEVCILVDRIMPLSSFADWSTESFFPRGLHIGRQNNATLEFWRLVDRIMTPSRSADWSKNHAALEFCRLVEESCFPRGLQIGRRIILPSRSAYWSTE
ncbi:hypothetical protein J6590_028272 [Homalodisca vitripennis]|nr:hypothetical protein J6590_028272 [Homalodisca vitripennis]